MPVENDPRQWSPLRKNICLALISSGAMISGLASNIQNPAIQNMEEDLPATASEISWSLSLFILIQGAAPILWSAISEVKGRRIVYLVSLSIFTVGSIIVATSQSIGLVIGFRCAQAAGSSAVFAIGSATLADIFEPSERGSKMGIYYAAPMLGPSLASVLGGALTQAFDWRGVFWFLSIVSGSCLVGFLLFFRDTYRRERSMAYQAVLKKHLRAQMRAALKSQETTHTIVQELEDEKATAKDRGKSEACDESQHPADLEKRVQRPALPEVKVTLRDVNPFAPVWLIVQRWNNVNILFASGLLFSFNFVVTYDTSRILGSTYGYSALNIGFVLLAYGTGCMAGSIIGGRWSDYKLAQLTKANNDISYPEMRLRSTLIGLPFFPLFVAGYGWIAYEHVHIAAVCVMLWICGFFSTWVYASTLAYIVDANVGRSSTAVATNSCFRGVSAFVGTEIVVPIQVLFDRRFLLGWLFTIWAFLMFISSALILLVMCKGNAWREAGVERELRRQQRKRHPAGDVVFQPSHSTQPATPHLERVTSQVRRTILSSSSERLLIFHDFRCP
ncbi:MFS general substrate transporter [Fistulina hepatica ATCC 64428]|uniref:MFS general substrate transporter n=1 Tax=Fistulina hepatica ATCC 64428 TaxID=1128425 RepID=A0A0D7ALJ1_9AGAR|nr:MFS general substrate transporter [Fistulina hepatica ATCC 64428]